MLQRSCWAAATRPDFFPEVADGRGVLAPGNVADVALSTAADIGAVRTVIVAGRVVIADGKFAGNQAH